jgi:hypothetical protein
MTNPEALVPFVVLYTTKDFNVPEPYQVNAVDSEDAEEKTYAKFPDCDITWVVETDSIETAFDVYHNESSLED